MKDEQDLLPKVSRQLWALIAADSAGVAILLVWITPFESDVRPIAFLVMFAAFALALRFWNVRRSLAALRAWEQDFGRSPIPAQASAWEIARQLISEKYVGELQEARSDKRTLLAWSTEYALRVAIFFAALYLFIAVWTVSKSGLGGLQTMQFREATYSYVICAITLGPLFLAYLVISEMFRRRKK